MFAGVVRISKETGQPLHRSLKGTAEYPYTISYTLRKRFQYDSFFELPKAKQPPDDIWDKPEELEEWFDKVFDYEKDKKKGQLDSITLNINDVEG